MITQKVHIMVILTVLLALVAAGCTQKPPVEPPEQAVEIRFIVLTTPQPSKVGEQLRFGWGITAEEGTVAMSTAVRYGKESTPGELGKDVTPTDTTYDRAPTAHISVSLPDNFASSLWTGSDGTIYYRFHAVIEGKNYWTDEYSVKIAPEVEVVEEPEPERVEETPLDELTAEQDETIPDFADYVIIVEEDEFVPDELTIKVGDTVQWKNERDSTQVTKGSAFLIWHSRSNGYSSVDFKGITFYPGETWEFTFEKEGKLAYTDAIFINAGIIGIINVES